MLYSLAEISKLSAKQQIKKTQNTMCILYSQHQCKLSDNRIWRTRGANLCWALGGMNLDHDFFQVSKSSEDQKKVFTKHGTGKDQKKKVFTTNGRLFFPEFKFFSPNSSRGLRSDAHQSQIIGGDADEDHTQIIGGIYPPIPPPTGFGTPVKNHVQYASSRVCLGQLQQKPILTFGIMKIFKY